MDNSKPTVERSHNPKNARKHRCPNCGEAILEQKKRVYLAEILKDGILHNVLIPQLTIEQCPVCKEMFFGNTTDMEFAAALVEHLKKPCDCEERNK